MHSMTGYGKSQLTIDGFEITIEIKSVNNRYLDIMFKMPAVFSSFEQQLRNIVKEQIQRGKVSIFVDLKEALKNDLDSVNDIKLQQRYNMLKTIQEKLNLKGEIELSHLLQFDELFEVDASAIDEDILFDALKKTLEQALEVFNLMRAKEGKHCIQDMSQRLDIIDKIIKEVKQKAPATVREEFEKQLQRINELLENNKIDSERLEQEVALISDKTDITEELTRFESHIQQFKQTLQRDSELGKKLTFILQEMHREANTINSKTTQIDIAHKIIQVKEEIEKIREQTQNIE